MKPKKISPILVYYRVALQRDFLLGYLSCRVHVFSSFYGFETFEKLVSKFFLFILFFFVRWSVSSIISGYVKSVPVWLRIFSRFCKRVPQAPSPNLKFCRCSKFSLTMRIFVSRTLRETSFVSWALSCGNRSEQEWCCRRFYPIFLHVTH